MNNLSYNNYNNNNILRNNQCQALKVVHWNSFKMTRNKCAELKYFIKQNNPDIISLNEIKLNEQNGNEMLPFNNYDTYYNPRSKNSSFGGGVALIVKSCLRPIASKILKELNLKTVELKLTINKQEILLVSYYNQELQSDHYPIQATFELAPNKENRTVNNELRFDYNRANWTKFKNVLNQINTSIEHMSIQELNSFIRDNIINAAKIPIPTFQFKINNTSLPDNVIKLIKERRKVRAEVNTVRAKIKQDTIGLRKK